MKYLLIIALMLSTSVYGHAPIPDNLFSALQHKELSDFSCSKEPLRTVLLRLQKELAAKGLDFEFKYESPDLGDRLVTLQFEGDVSAYALFIFLAKLAGAETYFREDHVFIKGGHPKED